MSNINLRLNPLPIHNQIQQLPLQNPPIYPTYNPLHSPQFTPAIPPINPHYYHDHPLPYHRQQQQTLNYGGMSDYEKSLRDEVIYLHSLWHRGPPLPTISNPNPPRHVQSPHLKPSLSTPFKKKKKKKPSQNTHLISDKEWPVDRKPTCDSTGWAEFKARPAHTTRPASAEEQARALALRIQLKGLDSCIGLFKKKSGDSSDEDDNDDDDDEDDDYADDCDEEFEFLLKVFEGDDQLRGFYEKNWENGEFYCLVCGVTGNKLGRMYKNCVALVQHSVSISRTKKKKAHRAYGYVVCKVLGWDINRLPSLPASNGDGSAQSLEKSNEVQGEVKNHADGCANNTNVGKLGGDSLCTKDGQAEPKDIPDAVDKDNVNSTDERCDTDKRVHIEGEVQNNVDVCQGYLNVKMQGDSANNDDCPAEAMDISGPVDGDDISSKDGGCIASGISQSGEKSNADGCEENDHNTFKSDGDCIRAENVQLEEEMITDSVQSGNTIGDKGSNIEQESSSVLGNAV